MMATPATAPIAIPALAPPLRPSEAGMGDGRALAPVSAAPAVAAVALEVVVAGAAVLDVDEEEVVDVADRVLFCTII